MGDTVMTPARHIFAENVANGKTYADAYRTAYPASLKWKDESVWSEASKLMAIPMVAQRVEELKQENIKRNQVTVDQVLLQLKNWLLFDPLELIDPDTEAVKSLTEMTKETRMSLAEIHVQEIYHTVDGVKLKIGELKKIKFIDKRATADMFMKKFGQYVSENNDVVSNLDAIKSIIEEIKK